MEYRKEFLLGVGAGVALLLIAIIGFIGYLYFKGAAIGEEKLARQQTAEAEQIQKFGTICSKAIPEALVYLHKTLMPTLNAYQEGRSNKEAPINLMSGVKNQNEFLRHCATQIPMQNEKSIKYSMQLMSASAGFASVYALLNGLRINNCVQECQKILVQRATDAAQELENTLRGKNER